MKENTVKSSFRTRLTYAGLCLACVTTLAVQGLVEARESYANLVSRILSAPPEGAEIREDMEQAILVAVNAYRKSKGVAALKPIAGTMRSAARAHAMDLLSTATMGHTASSGHDFASRMRALQPGKLFLPPMAENAARQRQAGLSATAKAQKLVLQWIGSQGHRKNLVNRTYTRVATGTVMRGNDVYAVQIFLGPEVKTNLNQ